MDTVAAPRELQVGELGYGAPARRMEHHGNRPGIVSALVLHSGIGVNVQVGGSFPSAVRTSSAGDQCRKSADSLRRIARRPPGPERIDRLHNSVAPASVVEKQSVVAVEGAVRGKVRLGRTPAEAIGEMNPWICSRLS
jgi:hypothetical protein